MSIKFKKREQECDYITTRGVATSNGGYLTEFIKVCWWNEVPIRNWGFSPTSIYKRWSEKTPVPSSELVTIVFPEYDKAIDYEHLKNFRYKIVKGNPHGYTPPDVIELNSDKDLKNIPATNDGAVSFRVSYKNFHLLKEGRNEIEIDCTVVATNKNGIEEDLGKRSFSIIIEKVKQEEITDPYITTDKNEYYLTYIKSTEELLGDTSVKVSCHNFPEIRRLYADIILTYQNNDTIIAAAFTGFAEQTVPSVIIMNVTKGSDIKDIPIGKHTLSKFMSQMHTSV
ncbi:hypothetical protein [Capnocytophaga catalasegens]|uniref:Uncharacterized protein n=1 Tax=Capnocytophaga catalasegens TaxID=1004260 RepID=A0AAV5AYG4_9FLAO|nr:hypothetical protein [Capnocytophaga catalasegens]GIZ15318.1 hypothetical protein RCZ03_13180 [Capnocytophaga catalasegens]GJM50485.1 hypothetical protein RCZ15_14580 [Capnocytophaga catalasegens]GJM52089.1 hypothetical protein RCZ16_04070 [Capnocytophaga catalasegens]